MSNDLAQIDQRLRLVEATLIQVRQRLALTPPPENWGEQISGSLADISDDDYQQFLQCCQAVRQGDSARETA